MPSTDVIFHYSFTLQLYQQWAIPYRFFPHSSIFLLSTKNGKYFSIHFNYFIICFLFNLQCVGIKIPLKSFSHFISQSVTPRENKIRAFQFFPYIHTQKQAKIILIFHKIISKNETCSDQEKKIRLAIDHIYIHNTIYIRDNYVRCCFILIITENGVKCFAYVFVFGLFFVFYNE